MKKRTPSPLITGSGDRIGKLSPNSERNYLKSRNPALGYVIAAAKKVRRVFSPIFFRSKTIVSKKVQSNSRNSQPGSESPYYMNNYSAHDIRNPSRSRHSNYDAFPEVDDNVDLKSSLTFEEIYKATGNFSLANKIGEGGFGTVYKAKLKNGSFVAVKRAKKEMYDQRLSEEFKNEITALSTIEHLSLVQFYGYIEHGDERLIIVEYVTNGTLRQHLNGAHGSGLETSDRLDISIDIAHAITYLHNYADPPIIHRDIKSTNILITETLRAKVADFGFARLALEDSRATHISTQIKGTTGYLDPEYLKTYQLSEKSDVYSFGVLLVEMMTGRYPIESKRSLDERVTIHWALRNLKHGEVVIAMDQRLRRSVASVKAVEKVLKLARQCLAPSKLSRPSMRKCAEILWEIRKEYRENTISAASTRFHSANVIGIRSRKNTFGIEDNNDLMFVSV